MQHPSPGLSLCPGCGSPLAPRGLPWQLGPCASRDPALLQGNTGDGSPALAMAEIILQTHRPAPCSPHSPCVQGRLPSASHLPCVPLTDATCHGL